MSSPSGEQSQEAGADVIDNNSYDFRSRTGALITLTRAEGYDRPSTWSTGVCIPARLDPAQAAHASSQVDPGEIERVLAYAKPIDQVEHLVLLECLMLSNC